MRRSSITVSAAFHLMMVTVATLGLPFIAEHEFIIPPPIVVDYIEISQVTETNKIAPPAPKKEKEIPKPAAPAVAKNTAEEAVAPVPKEKIKPDENKDLKKESKAEIDPNAPPDKSKKKDKKEEAQKTPSKDFASVLKNLAAQQDTAAVKTDEPDLNLHEKGSPAFGQNAPLGAKITMSEQDAFRSQLEKCWNVPFGAKDAENMVVEIFMVINPNRTLREARIVNLSRYNSDSFYRAAADSALRAVRSPLCSPFNLPPDKYDSWNRMTVTFNPKDMF